MWLTALVASGLEIHIGLSSDYKRLKQCNGINILKLMIPKAHSLYIDKKLSPLQLMDCYLKMIAAMNHILGAVLHVHLFARDMAHSMPYSTHRMIFQQPLYGISVLVKGKIALEPLSNTTGSDALKDNKQPDAAVVERLRKTGAIVFGTCNLSKFTSARSLIPPEGWSHLGRETINLYNLNKMTMGSSLGSAVAVAANLALVSLGTETLGSVISPASCNMVVGFKPTYNWTSTKGILPLILSLDMVTLNQTMCLPCRLACSPAQCKIPILSWKSSMTANRSSWPWTFQKR
ncbi:hypothetical protein DSO57_1026308 [Entomophthora muscae]|uniref:Uncharacterized protein n=1 Tax=Entomophthora muscae TaxID=34485 RepID=A0ACC2U148_9FUNG|nr:hypothetical protein DSO57_1026308 [Entomophthora muscae]